jgi:hypothetical protein
MFTDFPLYDQLANSTDDGVSLTDVQKQTIVASIKTMSDREHEIVFALIRAHQIQSASPNLGIIPYDGKHMKKGIKFTLEQLPRKLQHILFSFVTMHRLAKEDSFAVAPSSSSFASSFVGPP